jgi:NDP-sugar pyrophosphorylase family protein
MTGGNRHHRPVVAVLQAGGRGSRLLPYTEQLPKPLVPVAGVPIIERLFRQLADAGITDVTCITGWLGNKIRDHFETRPDPSPRARVRFLDEHDPLGNFGAMARLGTRDATVIFAFADLVTDLDFTALLERHRQGGADVTLASHTEAYRVSLGEIVAEGSRVRAYREKPLKEFLICSGIAAIEASALSVLQAGKTYGISDFVNLAIEHEFRVEHWLHGATVLDVNSPAVLAAADERFAQADRPGK